MESVEVCPICIGDVVDGVNFCADKQHGSTCRECLKLYIQNIVDSSFFGACPCATCPNIKHAELKKRRLLLYDQWSTIVPPTLCSKYSSLANSLLAFLCGGCHALKSLDVGSACDPSSANCLYIAKYFADNPEKGSLVDYNTQVVAFLTAETNVEDFYQLILNKYFPQLRSVSSDSDAWDIFLNVLRGLGDPERRANLHLRYLRDRPRIKTACCNREHCFKCKTKDFHEGKSCVENATSLDHSVICCPTCGISLAKGDGCNTVTCVCGKQFSWSAEKENSDRCVLFAQAHPENTSIVCAQLLCTSLVVNGSDLLQAKAWQIRHRVEVSRALIHWFKKSYWPCPSQCCVVLALETLPEGVKEAVELWKAEKKAEVDRCHRENETAVEALFTSLFPAERERPAGAFKLINQSRRGLRSAALMSSDEKSIVASAVKWTENNREAYLKGLEQLELRSAKQFLWLYGNRLVSSTRPSTVSSPCAVEWDRVTSNPDLTYSNDNATVERVGSVSCYPAAFAAITSERAMFKVVVETAPKSSNWLTFGVAAKGLANSSSDGVGRTANTWGLSDDRSAASGNSILAANGTEVGNFRKLRVGDELSVVIDTSEGWAEVSVNEQELSFKFDIPPGAPGDYMFAMSFANDHRVTILCGEIDPKKAAAASNSSSATQPLQGMLNSDHTRMFHSLRKQIKALITNPADSDNFCALKVEGQEWVAICGGTDAAAEARFRAVEGVVYRAANVKLDASSSSSSSSAGDILDDESCLTWKHVLAAASWFRENRESLEHQRMVELATVFYSVHGDDAPFMAAINLVEYHTHRVEKEEHQASLAFMRVFPELCEDWYEYDFLSAEPVIEGVAKDCQCLPRHCKSCPKPVKRG